MTKKEKKASVADSILRGARQALAYAQGTADPSKYRVHTRPEIRARIKRRASKKTTPRNSISA